MTKTTSLEPGTREELEAKVANLKDIAKTQLRNISKLRKRAQRLEEQKEEMRSAFHTLISEPMPAIQTVWVEHHIQGGWRCMGSKSDLPGTVAYGPYQVVPGMLSLAELAQRDLFPRYDPTIKKWIVMRFTEARLPDDWNTPLESQWGATLEARKQVYNEG